MPDKIFNLDPAGKYELSRNAIFKQIVIQAAIEKARDLIVANIVTPPNPWTKLAARRDRFSRQLVSNGALTGNIETQLLALLAQFDDPQVQVDLNDPNALVLLLYNSANPTNIIDAWFDLMSGRRAGDHNTNATSYPPTDEI